MRIFIEYESGYRTLYEDRILAHVVLWAYIELSFREVNDARIGKIYGAV
jgi:hypothetical protein